MFDPVIGQFISDDPIEFDAGDPNLRRYVGNSPTIATDASGLLKVGLHVKVTSDAISLGGLHLTPSERTALLLGSVYPDVPLEAVASRVGTTIPDDEIVPIVDEIRKNWMVKAYRSVSHTLDEAIDTITGARWLKEQWNVSEVKKWWDSSSFVDPILEKLTEHSPEVRNSDLYRSHFGDRQWWHGMANGGTASGVRQQIQDRLLRAIRQYRDAAPLADKHYFELGQSIHTIEDLYTPSHTARNRDGEITRFQSYNAQSPAYHATADVFDQNPDAFDVNAPVGDAKTPEGRARQKLVTAQATRFLQLAIAIRQDKWGDERIRGALDQFLQLAANAETGGTDENFAPKQNAVSDAIDAAKKSSAAATDWILDKWKSFAW